MCVVHNVKLKMKAVLRSMKYELRGEPDSKFRVFVSVIAKWRSLYDTTIQKCSPTDFETRQAASLRIKHGDTDKIPYE